MKKLVIAAGTGFLGNILIDHFKNKVETIVILTRGGNKSIENINYIHWDAKTLNTWKSELNDADVLINMTGKSVDCRYHQKNKDLILSSRIASTAILGKAISECKNPPKTWLNSSTATIYRHSMNQEMDETSGEIGTGFSVNVATNWEHAFFSQQTPKTRKVALRTSIVLGKNGGALQPILNLVKTGFGGKQGKGDQKFSWIHETDFARSLEFIIKNPTIEGPINIVSPTPSDNSSFMKTLRTAVGIPFGIPLPKPLLEIGAGIIKTETELILKSRNVIPKKLQENNFQFRYADLTNTITDLTS
ncbi:TIGR01777 family oxidoreductase [Aquimarina sp. 2201CG14-23]|uniref:TIGR01777 family oxidoreductase n=1 Tax=Aquimarina mycalae TaxID=3040073 RepID=UPI0024781B7F|nr:TIGR01777 family oxidoreductase [Aquimarina sp. 2201CG14-23]MDH7444830.1 TIGR01777 family oxidoreductase [Aquimarina sp. 2201CG14-23]